MQFFYNLHSTIELLYYYLCLAILLFEGRVNFFVSELSLEEG